MIKMWYYDLSLKFKSQYHIFDVTKKMHKGAKIDAYWVGLGLSVGWDLKIRPQKASSKVQNEEELLCFFLFLCLFNRK